MKVLVTGTTGYIGRAVSHRLQTAGHTVIGLARGELAARTLAAAGIEAVRGDLADAAALRSAAASVEAVIETASADHAASTTALLGALAGTGKTYIRTSGTGVYTDLAGGALNEIVHTEDDGYTPIPPLAGRYAIDEEVLGAAGDGVRAIVLRPSMIYGYGASEQLPVLLRAAMRNGVSGYSGAGLNRYANVYLDDVAEAYLLALQSAEPGSVYNLGAAECDFKTIAEAIGTVLDLPARPFTDTDEAVRVLGPIWAMGMASNSRVDSSKARTELGWDPKGPALVDELTAGSYRRIWGAKDVTVVSGRE
jgi:nucleoside-diphosphate-sugar epimerase